MSTTPSLPSPWIICSYNPYSPIAFTAIWLKTILHLLLHFFSCTSLLLFTSKSKRSPLRPSLPRPLPTHPPIHPKTPEKKSLLENTMHTFVIQWMGPQSMRMSLHVDILLKINRVNSDLHIHVHIYIYRYYFNPGDNPVPASTGILTVLPDSPD